MLTVIDLFTREAVALVAATSFSGARVAEVLERASKERSEGPENIRVDNGTEFTSTALDRWAHAAGVQLDFSRPRKPTDNAFIEAFNGTLRRECLSQHWFVSVADAQATLYRWQQDYNESRPHSGLGGQTPLERRGGEQRRPGRPRP